MFLRLPVNSEVGQSEPDRNGDCLGKAALLCFFSMSNCLKEKGFASSSLSHHLHPAATFMLLMANEECQRWISPHHVLSPVRWISNTPPYCSAGISLSWLLFQPGWRLGGFLNGDILKFENSFDLLTCCLYESSCLGWHLEIRGCRVIAYYWLMASLGCLLEEESIAVNLQSLNSQGI